MTESMTFVLFGATGDLAKRKIYPALYSLYKENKLKLPFNIVGLGRRELSDEQFQSNVRQSIVDFSRQQSSDANEFEEFIKHFSYSVLNVDNKDDYNKLLDKVVKLEDELGLPENRMFYLSVAPEFFDVIALNIKESGLGNTKGWKKLIIEKPFGHDLKTAQVLNDKLSKAFKEDEVYRIDHYLGKAMVQNIETIRFSNPIVESMWNNKHIANIQITASETVGVEERASYYDNSGAIRDMIQNHMLQMLMLVAMDKEDSQGDMRDKKVSALKSISPLSVDEVPESIVRAQYTMGQISGQPVVGYMDEPGVNENSKTDTFIAAKFLVNNDRWSGVPFYIRTGKRMKEKHTKIVVEFKGTETIGNSGKPNLLTIEINPTEGISYVLNSNNPFDNKKVEPVKVEHTINSKNTPEAYERLIFDALSGNSNFFARWDEVEYSWKLVEPILQAFSNSAPIYDYAAGSHGPIQSDELLKKDGFHWWN